MQYAIMNMANTGAKMFYSSIYSSFIRNYFSLRTNTNPSGACAPGDASAPSGSARRAAGESERH